MSTVNANVRLGYQNAAWFTTNAAVVLLSGQIVYRSTDGKYIIGDGSTAISGLTFYGGVSSSGLTVGTSTITGGTNTRILYNNSGVLGEYSVTGTGTTAVLSASPTFITSVNMGAATATGRFLDIKQDTATISIGSYTLATSVGAIYFNAGTPGSTNYAFAGSSTFSQLNAPTTNVILSVANTSKATFGVSNHLFQMSAATSGVLIPYEFQNPANTNQTLSTNIPNFKVTGSTKQWATGALTTQYFNYFSANTVSFVGASTLTNCYSLFVEASVSGTNSTITNNYAIGTGSGLSLFGNAKVGTWPTSSSYFCIAHESATISTGYSLISNGTNVILNASNITYLSVADGNQVALNSTRILFNTGMEHGDNYNIVFGTTNGTKLGTATTQKIGFWNATPIVQPASANQAALSLDVDVTGADTVDKAAINTNFTNIQTLVNQLRSDLVSAGLIKGSA